MNGMGRRGEFYGEGKVVRYNGNGYYMFANSMLTRTEERTGHNAAIYALRLAPNGFYSAAADGLLVHWHKDDVNFGRAVANVEGGKFLGFDTLEDGGLVAGALDGGVHWLYPDEPERNLHVAQHTRGVFAVLRVGEEVFTAGGDGVLTKWGAKTGRTIESLPVSGNSLRCIANYPENPTLAIGASDGMVYTVNGDEMSLTGKCAGNPPSTFCVAFQPGIGWPRMIFGGRDTRLNSFDVAFVKSPDFTPIDAHNSTINDLAFSPNGKYLATASRDKTVKLWDAHTWELLKVCEVVRDRGHVNSVNCLLWLDDTTLITAGDDRRILTWKLED
jgi:WD40 repeat protein